MVTIRSIAAWFDKHWPSDDDANHIQAGLWIVLGGILKFHHVTTAVIISLTIGFAKEVLFEQILSGHFGYSETWAQTRLHFGSWLEGIVLALVLWRL